MCKEILRNQKGMSLVEVVVASAVSIVIAMGVMQINDNAQKGISKMQASTAIQKFEDLVHSRLSKEEHCIDANRGGANTLQGTDVSADVAFVRLRTPFQTGGDPDEFVVSATETIPSAPAWKVTSAVMKAFDNGGTGALIGECNLEIVVEKVREKAIGQKRRIIKIPMSCRVNGANIIQSCSAIIDSDEEGYWKSTSDGGGGDFLKFSGLTGSPRIGIGESGWAAGETAGITLGNNLGPYAGAGAANHGIAIPNNTALSFGNGDQVALHYSGGFANTLENNGGFEVSNNIAANAIYAANIHSTNFRSGRGYMTRVDAIDIHTTRIWSGTPSMTGSDERFKKEIETIKNASESISELRGVTYFLRKDEFPDYKFNDRLQYGLIAQEVEKVFPELVTTMDDGYKSVQYANIVSILIEGFKEQKREIEKNREMLNVMQIGLEKSELIQNKRLNVLETENKKLRRELDELKEQVRLLIKSKK